MRILQESRELASWSDPEIYKKLLIFFKLTSIVLYVTKKKQDNFYHIMLVYQWEDILDPNIICLRYTMITRTRKEVRFHAHSFYLQNCLKIDFVLRRSVR